MEADQPIGLEDRKSEGKPLVLVVDDDQTHLRLLELLADRLHITAHTTSSGAEAIEAVRMFSFDVILMDCRMPEIDGYDCARRIRELSENTKNTPIVAVTADVMPDNLEKCLKAGMDDILLKPFTLEQLNDKLLFWLRKKEE
jgi:CheY-like chemotaxis protein